MGWRRSRKEYSDAPVELVTCQRRVGELTEALARAAAVNGALGSELSGGAARAGGDSLEELDREALGE